MSFDFSQIIFVSLRVAFITSVFTMIIALILALILHASRGALGAKIAEFLVYIPMAMPPVALGYGLLIFLGPSSVVGFWLEHNLGLRLAFNFWGAVLASFCVSLGIGLRAMLLALEQIDQHHSEIAELLGASKFQVFFHVTLPLCKRALLAGFFLVFVRSLGEFGATIVFAGNALGLTRTLSVAIWSEMQKPDQESNALFLVLLSLIIAFFALVASELFLRKKSPH